MFISDGGLEIVVWVMVLSILAPSMLVSLMLVSLMLVPLMLVPLIRAERGVFRILGIPASVDPKDAPLCACFYLTAGFGLFQKNLLLD